MEDQFSVVVLVVLAPLIVSFNVWSYEEQSVFPKILIFCVCCLANAALGYGTFLVIKRLIRHQIREIERARELTARQDADAVRAIACEYFEKLEILSDLINASDTSISRAKIEFSQNAFASFWNAIDDAIRKLIDFQKTATAIGVKHWEYETVLSRLVAEGNEHTFPGKLRISASDVPDPQTTLQRLERYVRKGETDFRFASILEQRTTRRVLMAGFQHVDTAIQHLQTNLVASLANIQLILATR